MSRMVMPRSSRRGRMKHIMSMVSRGFMPAVGSFQHQQFGLGGERPGDFEAPFGTSPSAPSLTDPGLSTDFSHINRDTTPLSVTF